MKLENLKYTYINKIKIAFNNISKAIKILMFASSILNIIM
jgi:hypothetical protein